MIGSAGESSSAAAERDAERLYEAITAACASGAGFAERVEAALGSALGLLAAEPDLAWALTIEPELGDEVAIRRHQRWKQRYGALLRQAAEEDPEIPSRPPFLEPALVGGIRRLIAQQVLCGEAERLEELLPGVLGFTLSYYLGIEEGGRFVSAAEGGDVERPLPRSD